MPERKQLLLHAFDMNCLSHIWHGLWAHPDNQRVRFNELEFWVELAEVLEAGGFDALFLADVLGAYETFRGGPETAVREGLQIPNNEPMLLIAALAARVKHLGFVVTSSTTYEPPFAFARRMSTLDHLTGGRIAWNMVTSWLPTAARNFNMPRVIEHDKRYEYAEEYLEVLYELWEGSWEDDAVVADRATGVYARPEKVHPIDHVGERHQVRGPHLSEPSRQRTPLLYQAGTSAAGQVFGGRHAEAVFVQGPDGQKIREYIASYRAQAAAGGRDPAHVKFVGMSTVIVGRTDREVRHKVDDFRRRRSVEGHLAGTNARADITGYPPETPIADLIAAEIPGWQSLRPVHGQTVGDVLGALGSFLGGAFDVAGTPGEVADAIEHWLDVVGIDGINMHQFLTPGTATDFTELVSPELRRRGRLREAYVPGETMRERFFGAGHTRLFDDHPAAAYRR